MSNEGGWKAKISAGNIIRVGLLVDCRRSEGRAHALASLARAHCPAARFALIRQTRRGPIFGKDCIENLFYSALALKSPSRLLLDLIGAVEALCFRLRHAQRPDHSAVSQHQELFYRRVVVASSGRKAAFGSALDLADIAKLSDLGLDVIVKLHERPCSAQLFELAPFGVVALSPGVVGLNGGPAGFFEVWRGEDYVSLRVVCLAKEGGKGTTLFEGSILTRRPYARCANDIELTGNYFICLALKRLLSNARASGVQSDRPTIELGAERLSLATVASYVVNTYRSELTKRLVRRRKGGEGDWRVAFARGGWRELKAGVIAGKIDVIEPPPGCFHADPFLFHENGDEVCFIEEFDGVERQRGYIVVYDLSGEKPVRLGEALVEPFHLSFPFVFRFDGKIYMCPETSAASQIRLYECLEFPLRWKLSRVLLDGIKAVDSIVFENRDLWWMLTNDDAAGTGEFSGQLSAFFAESPLSDAWRPHPLNPICVDAAIARNGGLLLDGDAFFRVAQSQGFGVYGKGFSLRKIERLDKEGFREEEAAVSAEIFGDSVKRTHHLSGDREGVVFDFVGRLNELE